MCIPPIAQPAASLYIHVPFCATRCNYCDFYSTTFTEDKKESYTQSLIREMLERKYEAAPLQTIYFGGGTPSQLSEKQIRNIFKELYDIFTLSSHVEITFECNPDDITPRFASLLHDIGVNRVSLGIQTFDNHLLAKIRRRHTAETAHEAVRLLSLLTTPNISIDLIYGLPGQSLKRFQADVKEALSLPITHLSAYALSIEPGTLLHSRLLIGEIKETSDEMYFEMYNHLMETTQAAGFEHYEISNFALPGKESRHNSAYWNGASYIGLGPAAHSYDGGFMRRENLPDLKAYCSYDGHVPFKSERLTRSQRYNEIVMTRLRTRNGLRMDLLNKKERDHLLQEARFHLNSGHLEFNGNVLKLTRCGIFISDGIISDLMMED